MITYISLTVGDMKTKLFLLKTNVLKFTQQKFERKNQRNKRFIKRSNFQTLSIASVEGDVTIPRAQTSSFLNFACHFCMVRRSGGCFENSVQNLR